MSDPALGKLGLLFLLLWGGSACQFLDTVQPADCLTTDDCAPGDVCFYGRCSNPGSSFSEVFIDFTPPNSSHLLPQMDLGSPRNLAADGLQHDFILRASMEFPGQVQTEAGERRTGTLTALPRHGEDALPLPSTRAGIQAAVADSGFKLAVVPGQYDLVFEPGGPAPRRPPFRWTSISLADRERVASLQLDYPSDPSLITVNGRLMLNEAGGAPLAGAEVRGFKSGEEALSSRSTTGVTDDAGRFEITFPPAVDFYDLKVGPGAAPRIPAVTISNLLISPDAPSTDLDLGLPTEPIRVEITVKGHDGAPEQDAKVVFRGSIGTALAPGEILTHSRADSNGAVTADLFPGLYTITAIPLKRSKAGIGRRVICVATPADAPEICGGPSENFGVPLSLTVPRRQPLTGLVLSHDGQRVPGARIVFTYPGEVVAREFTAHTGDNGAYAIALDPLLDPEASYEVTVEPPLNLGFPRFRQFLRVPLPPGESHIVTLYRPSLVYGLIRGPDQNPVSEVVVSFYSTELGTEEEPLLVGLGRSTEQGQFTIALPTLE